MSEAVVRGRCDIVRVSKRCSVPALKVKEGDSQAKKCGWHLEKTRQHNFP